MSDKLDKDEMARMINAWQSSKKYTALKKELNIRKKELKDMTTLSKEKMLKHMKDNGMSKEELQTIINNIFEYDSLSDDDKEQFEWISDSLSSITTKEESYTDFIKTMMTWYTYVYIYQKMEDFEFCVQLKKVVDIERKNFIKTLKSYFEFEAQDEVIIQHIEQSVIDKILLAK